MSAKEENDAMQKLADESAKTVELSRKFHEAIRKSGPPPKRDKDSTPVRIAPLYTPSPMMSPFANAAAAAALLADTAAAVAVVAKK
jgi:hypothetical protein